MNVGISALSCFLPEHIISDDEIAFRFGRDYADKILPMTGILERRVASGEECASDLAFLAAKKIFDNTAITPGSIDLLVFGTQTGDYIMPSSACLLQRRLGIQTTCAAFDVNLGCSQLVYGLGIAHSWIKSGMAKRALVLSGDTPTKLLDSSDGATVSVFGDGAAAVVVEEVSRGGILGFDFGTDGMGAEDLIVRGGGMRSFHLKRKMEMNGVRILTFALKDVPSSVERALARAKVSISEVDLFVFHQASAVVVKSLAKKMDIPDSKVFLGLEKIGNIGGSSVGHALAKAHLEGRIRDGSKVVISSFGVGFSWGSAVLDWSGEGYGGTFL